MLNVSSRGSLALDLNDLQLSRLRVEGSMVLVQ